MTSSKVVRLLGFLLFTAGPGVALAQNAVDPYQKQLNRLKEEMQSFGVTVDVFGENPFQTGTSLSQYYLNEKTLLLEEKTFFQVKANDLSSTDAVADLQYRNKVLRSHANNILLQLSQAIRNRKEDGFLSIEPTKQKESLEKITADCELNAECVARRLSDRETAIENVLVDNLEAAGMIFSQMPYMHAIEAMSVYQLTQMIYLEVLKNQTNISLVEFDLYYDKQAALAEKIAKNPSLTTTERRMQIELANHTVNRWKKRILDRRNAKDEYFRLASSLRSQNETLANEILEVRKNHASTLAELYAPKQCKGLLGNRRRNWCEGLEKFQHVLGRTAAKKGIFVDAEGASLAKRKSRLPDAFFENLSP